jgi:hypothetical protein
MKNLTCVVLIVLAISVGASAPRLVTAEGEAGSVTGAGRAAIPQGSLFGSVALSGLDFGTGVLVEPDGSATGPFTILLTGRSLVGQPRQITVDGTVLQGALAPNGQAYLSGIATVNLGNGTPALAGVPFTVTAKADGLALTLNSIALPAVQLSKGAIVIE